MLLGQVTIHKACGHLPYQRGSMIWREFYTNMQLLNIRRGSTSG
jgi:hypothetical protein